MRLSQRTSSKQLFDQLDTIKVICQTVKTNLATNWLELSGLPRLIKQFVDMEADLTTTGFTRDVLGPIGTDDFEKTPGRNWASYYSDEYNLFVTAVAALDDYFDVFVLSHSTEAATHNQLYDVDPGQTVRDDLDPLLDDIIAIDFD